MQQKHVFRGKYFGKSVFGHLFLSILKFWKNFPTKKPDIFGSLSTPGFIYFTQKYFFRRQNLRHQVSHRRHQMRHRYAVRLFSCHRMIITTTFLTRSIVRFLTIESRAYFWQNLRHLMFPMKKPDIFGSLSISIIY